MQRRRWLHFFSAPERNKVSNRRRKTFRSVYDRLHQTSYAKSRYSEKIARKCCSREKQKRVYTRRTSRKFTILIYNTIYTLRFRVYLEEVCLRTLKTHSSFERTRLTITRDKIRPDVLLPASPAETWEITCGRNG